MASNKKLVVLSGAGISAESGLQTFRDSDGLWNGHRIEEVATYEAFKANPQMVLDFYNMRRRDVLAAKPNAAHIALAELQQDFDVHIITQNIDDLHERAGSKQVVHLHGEILKMKADGDDSQYYDITKDINVGDVTKNGVQLRPHVVWFGEAVPMIDIAAQICMQADIFLVVGTSLAVYPAAGLTSYVPRNAHMFALDKVIPESISHKRFVKIEKPATEGIADFISMIKAL